jgi:mono/diheme cytochrome c family protein
MGDIATYLRAVLTAVVGVAVVATVQAGQSQSSQQPGGVARDSASDLFRNYCAACHGASAKGDGPLAANMKKRPPDLTLLAKQNGGTYPADLVFKIIDGRRPVPGHGGPDMPAWGDAFKASSAVGGSEEVVRDRIQALVDYLGTLQQKGTP